jgi:hypothetical protein
MSQESTIGSNFTVCATCALWGGGRMLNPLRSLVTFYSDSRGECLGGGFNRSQMSPMASCNKYQRLPSLKV